MVRRRVISGYMFFVIVILMASLFLSACNAPQSLLGGEDEDPAETAMPGDGGSDSDSSESGDDSDIPTFSGLCPLEDIQGELEFKHDIVWGLEGVGKFRVEVKGSQLINVIRSIVTHEPEDQVGVHNIGQTPIPVTLSAIEFEDCTNGTGQTTMRVYVTGTCIDGALTLYIQEYYEASSVTMICDDDDEVEIPLPIGAMEQPKTWTMPILDALNTPQSYLAGFMGIGGSGGFGYTFTLP